MGFVLVRTADQGLVLINLTSVRKVTIHDDGSCRVFFAPGDEIHITAEHAKLLLEELKSPRMSVDLTGS